MGSPEMRVNEASLTWEPAEVVVPPVPGTEDVVDGAASDPMSLMVQAILPSIADDVVAKVAATRAREQRFAENISAARTAYSSTDGAAQGDISGAGRSVSDAGSASRTSSSAAGVGAGSPGDGMGQFGQLLSMAMQMGQQAVQVPMQMAGMAGQSAQPISQGVQGIVQQASQAEGKSDGTGERADEGQPGGGDAPSGESELAPAEDKRVAGEEDKGEAEKHDKEKSNEKAPGDRGAGATGGSRAPVTDARPDVSSPNGAPDHRRTPDVSAEVVL